MKQRRKEIIILWSKRVAGTITIVIWIFAIAKISQIEVPFEQQAGYCMFSTMMIFASLTGIFKILEYFEKKSN